MWRVVVARGVSPSSFHQPQLATWASCGTSYATSCGTTLILNLLGLTSKLQPAKFRHQLAWELGFLVVISIGMAISAWSMGTRPGLTLMDRVLPSQIKNRVRLGILKKITKRVWILDPTPPVYDKSKTTKIPTYIYIYIYHLCQTLTHFSNISHSSNRHSKCSHLTLKNSLSHFLSSHPTQSHPIWQLPSPSLSFTHWPTLTFTPITWWKVD